VDGLNFVGKHNGRKSHSQTRQARAGRLLDHAFRPSAHCSISWSCDLELRSVSSSKADPGSRAAAAASLSPGSTARTMPPHEAQPVRPRSSCIDTARYLT
jgi:hypothetical protein